MIGQSIVFVSLTIAFLGVFMYIPLPAGVENPWTLRAVTLLTDAVISYSYIVEKVTGTPISETFDKLTYSINATAHHKYPDIQFEEAVFDGIPVYVYRPKTLPPGQLAPCLVYYHGGGWVVSNLDNYDEALTRLSLGINAIVVGVKYRCAPKNPFPVPFEDSVKAMAHVLRNGESLGIDVNRVAIAGDSAGGNLAATVALRLSQEDPSVFPRLKLQVLVCPVIQALSFNTNSMKDFGNFYLKKSMMIYFWAAYLGLDLTKETYGLMAKDEHVSPSIQRSIYGSYLRKVKRAKVKDVDKYDAGLASKLDHLVVEPMVSPMMADDLSTVPPAYILAMEFDILRDDALTYADRLKSSGVKTDVWLVKGYSHIASFPIDEILLPLIEYIKERL